MIRAASDSDLTLKWGDARSTLRCVGSVSSNVTVMEAAPDLELTTSEVGGVIHGSQTNALPVNGRHWASLMALIPGAVSSGTGTQDAIRFAGLSQEDNNFRFDGVDATGLNHQFVKEPARLQFPLESIAEFKASSGSVRMWEAWLADRSAWFPGRHQRISRIAYEYLRNSFDAKALTRRRSRCSDEQFWGSFGTNYPQQTVLHQL